MKLRKPDGTEVHASISKGKSIVLTITGTSTGAKTREELDQYIKGNNNEKLGDYEIIEASDKERELLREAGHNMKGL